MADNFVIIYTIHKIMTTGLYKLKNKANKGFFLRHYSKLLLQVLWKAFLLIHCAYLIQQLYATQCRIFSLLKPFFQLLLDNEKKRIFWKFISCWMSKNFERKKFFIIRYFYPMNRLWSVIIQDFSTSS